MEAYLPNLIGGILIGLAASGMLLFNGRIMGVSGIYAGTIFPNKSDLSWRVLFIVGTIIGGAIYFNTQNITFNIPDNRNLISAALGGLLVGFGTNLGSGCTSGHGVCGLSRFSPRSLVATTTFLISGIISATIFGLIFKGGISQ